MYLDTCVRSILAQRFGEFELLLIDDGSTDESSLICDRYSAQDMRVITIHQENRGLSSARNTGLRIAKGKYVAFVDSDDYIPSTMLFDLLSVIKATGADMVKGNFQKVNEDGEISKLYNESISVLTSEMAIDNFLNESPKEDKKISTVVWNALYSRALFETISFPEGFIYEDGYVTPQLLLKSNFIAHLNKVVYFYRQNPNGIMGSGLTEVALKSIDDQKTNHFIIINKYTEFARITCEHWLDKYLDMLYALKVDNERISPDVRNRYILYIRRELLNNMWYFKKQGIQTKRLLRILVLSLFNF